MGGGDKALADLSGKPLLSHVIDRFAPQVRGLALSANGDPDRFRAFGLPVLPDSLPDYPGPLAGVLAGLDWAAQAGADHIVTVAADTPFLPPHLVDRLVLAALDAHEPIALAATDDGLHPTCGLWPVSMREDLRLALNAGTRKVVAWAAGQGMARCLFSAQPQDPFFNINTPEDLAQAQVMLGGDIG